MTDYGKEPIQIGRFPLPWQEFMSYLYLPVQMTWDDRHCGTGIRLPKRLEFLRDIITVAHRHEYGAETLDLVEHGGLDCYIYITAKRGYATPGNPLNRPGWHTDGFGSDDVNYVWASTFPTTVAVQDFGMISPDHIESVAEFDDRVRGQACYDLKPETLYRFDPYVVHRAPDIPAPGGMRSFLKISFSKHRYNLIGNSHNYLFDYDWVMHDRDEIRNDPHYAGGDFYAE